MIRVDVSIEGATAVRQALQQAGPEIQRRWFNTMRRAALKATRTIQTQYRGAAATTGSATRQGTGALRGSYTERTRQIGAGGVESQIGLYRFGARGNALIYGHVHEQGETIRPARAQFLAIPLSSIRRPSGLAPRPSDFPRSETFVRMTGADRGVIMRRLPDGSVVPIFALRRSVYVPPRPGGGPTTGGAINVAVNDGLPALANELLNDAAEAVGG